MNEKISVVVPVYKAEAYLARCVDSILAQTGVEPELILIDDGSPDRSGEICDAYAQKDPRVKVIHKENAGVSAARNSGIDAATGDWVYFCDADDELFPDSLAKMLEEGRESDLILSGHETYHLTPRRNLLQTMRTYERPTFTLERAEFPASFHKLFVTDNLLSTWAKLFRLSLLRKAGVRFDPKLVVLEDYDFVLSYLPHCQKICSSSVCSYRWYRIDSAVPYYAKRSRLDYADDVIAVYQKHCAFLKEMKIGTGSNPWSVWKDLYGNFGTAFSALWAIPADGFHEKLQKIGRIRAVLRTPAFRSWVAFSRSQLSKKEYRYMKHPTLLSMVLLRREREKLGK